MTDMMLSTAVSGLQANAQRFAVSANNVVNANSDGFKAQSASTASVQPSGVTTNVTQTDQSVDVAQEFVSMIQSEAGYGANAAVVRTADQMTGTLLNVLA